jgi:hypothetical protein
MGCGGELGLAERSGGHRCARRHDRGGGGDRQEHLETPQVPQVPQVLDMPKVPGFPGFPGVLGQVDPVHRGAL